LVRQSLCWHRLWYDAGPAGASRRPGPALGSSGRPWPASCHARAQKTDWLCAAAPLCGVRVL